VASDPVRAGTYGAPEVFTQLGSHPYPDTVNPSSRPTSSIARPSARRRRALTALGTGALAVLLATSAASPSGAAPGTGGGSGDGVRQGPDLSARLSAHKSTGQTSDGVPGRRVAPLTARQQARARTITTTVTAQWAVAPGVTFQRFDRNDSVRGNVRGQLLTLDMNTPGLAIDYTSPKRVARTETVDQLTAAGAGVAGINGDFFDIGDTGAALGIGSSRARGLIQGPVSGWNNAFYVDSAGAAHIGGPSVVTTLKQKPRFTISALNPPSVPKGGIAAYDDDWGQLDGYQVTDGQKKNVRQVVIRNKKVISNSPRLTRKGRVQDQVLIGRGKGAKKLGYIRVGSRARLSSSIVGSPSVVITGNKPLLLGGVRQVIDDSEMHPRTAIGIDNDTNKIFMLVLDGRQSFSRGMTMVELAQLMAEYGADDALNLDGGGSSTMMARDAFGVMGVQNSPSDGSLRKVANGLVVTSDPTAIPPAPVPVPAPVPPA
jgi:hypothetical protein